MKRSQIKKFIQLREGHLVEAQEIESQGPGLHLGSLRTQVHDQPCASVCCWSGQLFPLFTAFLASRVHVSLVLNWQLSGMRDGPATWHHRTAWLLISLLIMVPCGPRRQVRWTGDDFSLDTCWDPRSGPCGCSSLPQTHFCVLTA